MEGTEKGQDILSCLGGLTGRYAFKCLEKKRAFVVLPSVPHYKPCDNMREGLMKLRGSWSRVFSESLPCHID